jgi:hypothetical protein
MSAQTLIEHTYHALKLSATFLMAGRHLDGVVNHVFRIPNLTAAWMLNMQGRKVDNSSPPRFPPRWELWSASSLFFRAAERIRVQALA